MGNLSGVILGCLKLATDVRSGSADKEVRLWQMDPVAKTFNCTHTIEERFATAPHSFQCVVKMLHHATATVFHYILLVCLHVLHLPPTSRAFSRKACAELSPSPPRGRAVSAPWVWDLFRGLRPGPISKIHVLGGHLFAFTQERSVTGSR